MDNYFQTNIFSLNIEHHDLRMTSIWVQQKQNNAMNMITTIL